MDDVAIITALGGTIVTLSGVVVKVTQMLLKEKDSKIQMLREFYELTKKGDTNG